MPHDGNIQKVCVLASNSFTGSHLVDYLLTHTDVEVLGVSRSPEYDPTFLPYAYRKAKSPRFAFHQVDLNRDFDTFRKLCDDFQPDAVVNFAAQGEVRNSWKWPEQWYQTNCLGVVRVAEYLKDKSYLKRYVAASTPEVYGATGLDIKENHTYQPSTPYAASKLAGDLHLMALQKHTGFPAVFTRAANLYGIHQQLYRIIPRAIIYIKLGKIIELHGNGSSQRAFIHARDVADATWKAILQGRNGNAYHVAPEGELITIANLVRLICEEMNADFDAATRPIKENFGQDSVFSMDASQARSELEWQPRVNLIDGIRETVTWIEDNWEFIRNQPLEYSHKK